MIDNNNFEDEILEKTLIAEYISKFSPEIRDVFYASYGKNLEALPQEMLKRDVKMDEFLKRILEVRKKDAQKVILLRVGILTGTPMTLQVVGDTLGISREKVRLIESNFIRRRLPLIRHKKLVDYLDD
ncbi:MAG: hypothetical protein IKY23_12520 [Lachnospiraceae bacterium]|nr:hypothetical protein [Lachnospiraceae bacterium]